MKRIRICSRRVACCCYDTHLLPLCWCKLRTRAVVATGARHWRCSSDASARQPRALRSVPRARYHWTSVMHCAWETTGAPKHLATGTVARTSTRHPDLHGHVDCHGWSQQPTSTAPSLYRIQTRIFKRRIRFVLAGRLCRSGCWRLSSRCSQQCIRRRPNIVNTGPARKRVFSSGADFLSTATPSRQGSPGIIGAYGTGAKP